jgi:glutamate dehydrogenase/leucine dehydrogenase
MSETTVKECIERNAEGIMTPEEMQAFETPHDVHEYEAWTPEGLVTAVRTQHRIGEDGSGGGFKVIEVANGRPLEDRLASNRRNAGRLAALMTLKGNLVDLDLPQGYGNDFGGAKGEMYVPPGTLSSRDRLNAILSDYVLDHASRGTLGIGVDRYAPDMNTGSPEMDHMSRVLREYTGDSRATAAFSGKSIEAGGLEGREIATGQGLVYALANHLEAQGLNPTETTVAVQGSGNVGCHFARLAAEQLGVKIIGMSDRDRAVVTDKAHPLRLDETLLFGKRMISGWDESAHRSLNNPDDMLEMDVDVFVFAAAPDAITEAKGNKTRLRAKHLIMGSNDPLDRQAIDYYLSDGRALVADFLGNPGGFIASNFEYNQGMTGIRWTEALAMSALKRAMDDAWKQVYDEAEAAGDTRNMVDPAYRVAMKRQYARDHSGLFVPS